MLVSRFNIILNESVCRVIPGIKTTLNKTRVFAVTVHSVTEVYDLKGPPQVAGEEAQQPRTVCGNGVRWNHNVDQDRYSDSRGPSSPGSVDGRIKL